MESFLAGQIIQGIASGSVIIFVGFLRSKYKENRALKIFFRIIVAFVTLLILALLGEKYGVNLPGARGHVVTNSIKPIWDRGAKACGEFAIWMGWAEPDPLPPPPPQPYIPLVDIPSGFPEEPLVKVNELDETIEGLKRTRENIEKVKNDIEKKREDFKDNPPVYKIGEVEGKDFDDAKKRYDENIATFDQQIDTLKRKMEIDLEKINKLSKERNDFITRTTTGEDFDAESFLNGLALNTERDSVRKIDELYKKREAAKKTQTTTSLDATTSSTNKTDEEFVKGITNLSFEKVGGNSQPGFND